MTEAEWQDLVKTHQAITGRTAWTRLGKPQRGFDTWWAWGIEMDKELKRGVDYESFGSGQDARYFVSMKIYRSFGVAEKQKVMAADVDRFFSRYHARSEREAERATEQALNAWDELTGRRY